MIDDEEGILPMWVILVIVTIGCALILSLVFPPQSTEEPTTEINNATIINNYYCNTTEPFKEIITVYETPDYGFTNTSRNPGWIAQSPTPALWNDTRRESVGLPKDRTRCCHSCTPTPTPTITEACEFPWLCKGGERR